MRILHSCIRARAHVHSVRHCICITIICLLEEYREVYIYTIQEDGAGRGEGRKEEGQDRGGQRHYWY